MTNQFFSVHIGDASLQFDSPNLVQQKKITMSQKASTYNILQQFSLLIQGPPGSGKTGLALQFPRPYVCDLDNNIGGTIRWMRSHNIEPDFEFDTPDILPDGITERPIKDRFKFMAECIKEQSINPIVDTIIVDGVTKLDMYIKGEIARQNPTIKGERRADGEMTLADWNTHLYLWQTFITKMQASSKMFILTCHEEFSDIAQLPGKILVNVQGKKVQQTLAGMFSDVWRTEIEKKVTNKGNEYIRQVRCMSSGTMDLKNSLALPDVFTMNWTTIKEALAKGNKPKA